MSKLPLVSIIVSTFNNSNSIEESIESLLFQTYENIEILLLDDCSSDETKSKVVELSKKNQKIRPFFNEHNLGLTKSLNMLIDNSKGEIIARHDADDISFQTRIEEQVNILVKRQLDFCTSLAIRNDNDKKIPRFSNKISKKIHKNNRHKTK